MHGDTDTGLSCSIGGTVPRSSFNAGFKEEIDLKMDALIAKLDARCAQMDAKFDAKFAQMDAKLAQMNAKLDAGFAQMGCDIQIMFGRVRYDMQGKATRIERDFYSGSMWPYYGARLTGWRC